MAEQLLYGDARDVGSQQIVSEGAPVRSTGGISVLGGAHTPHASMTEAPSMGGYAHLIHAPFHNR